jgi:hypothetical protein
MSDDLELLAGHELSGISVAAEGRDHLLRIGPVDHADALIASSQTRFEEGQQDLVPLLLVGVEAADVITQRRFDTGDTQIKGSRHELPPMIGISCWTKITVVRFGGRRTVTG